MQTKRDETDPSEQLWEEMFSELVKDEKGSKIGPEARRLLDKGIPIYYSDDAYPGETVKMYPDGQREIVAMDEKYNDVVVRKLPNERIN
jgi:hypothetical protein